MELNRRAFMRLAGAASVASAAAEPARLNGETGRAPRQAIVILGESVRYDMLNANAATGLKTPNLDRLAAQGVSFERAYNCQPVCAPARSAIWTGLNPHTNGVWGNSMPLGDTTHTIGQRLTDKGIHCAFVGKWHLDGVDYFGTGMAPAGWDRNYWYDMRDYLYELTPEDRLRSRNPATGDDPSWTADKCFAHRCTNRAVDFLEKHADEDFLLVLAFDEPHWPSLCPAEYSRLYEDFVFPSHRDVNDDLKNKPEEQRVWADGRLNATQPPIRSKHFFGSHTFVDFEIGRVLDAADKHAPGALTLYTSDHAVFLESHRLTDKGPAMYDEITRVPFLAKWPGKIAAGTRSKGLVSHIDIAGTLMEYFGFDVPRVLEGGSMLPLLTGADTRGRDAVFMEWGRYEVDHDGFGAFQPIRCVFDGRYKLAINLMTTDELYDLKNDPEEMNNLIGAELTRDVCRALHDRLLAWMNETRDPFRGYYWGRRAWREDFPVTWANAGMTRQRDSDGYLPRELDFNTGLPMTAATRPK